MNSGTVLARTVGFTTMTNGVRINASDWRDIADEIVVELVVECRIDRVETTDQQKRVAVCGRAHDGLGADIAAATRPVVDNKLLSEPLRQPLSDQAREDVDRKSTRLNSSHLGIS